MLSSTSDIAIYCYTCQARLESIVLHLLRPDQLSVKVAHHLLRAPHAHRDAASAQRGFELSAQMTRLRMAHTWPHDHTTATCGHTHN